MSLATVVIVIAIGLVVPGCASRGADDVADVRRANAELKARVAALESEVADLKLQRTPLTVDGLTLGTLGPPPELKLTSTARPAEWGTSLGQGRMTYIAGGGVGN